MNVDDLKAIADYDIAELVHKDAEYGSSWKKRGGGGSFHMLARKWDRLEEQVKKHNYDIFAAIKADPRTEGILDDIGDLARYLLLVRAEARSWGVSAQDKASGPGPVRKVPRPTPQDPLGDGSFREPDRLHVDGQQHPFGYDYKAGEEGA